MLKQIILVLAMLTAPVMNAPEESRDCLHLNLDAFQ